MENFDYNDDKIKKIINIIKDSYHPSGEELGNYILYKNGIDPEDQSFIRLVPKIEHHLRKCSSCSKLFLELNDEYASLDKFLIEEKSQRIVKTPDPVLALPKFYFFRYSGVTLIAVFLIALVTFSVSRIFTPLSYKYADLENQTDLYQTRGRITYDFQKSLMALEIKDYENAVKFLNEDIMNNRGEETIFYSYYLLGVTYLESANTEILGLFPSYDKIKVHNGVTALNKALELNNTGRFRNINFDIYFFLGKAELMLNNKKSASEYFYKVLKEKGSHINEAKNILSAID
jgi:tetratricopeptide (TPR) repeat protein